jgi:hypothetical protein
VGATDSDNFSVWSSASHSQVSDTNKVSSTGQISYDGSLDVFSLGFDKRLNDRLLVGFSLGRVDIDLDTPWNLGTYDSQGISIAPYFSYLLNDTLTLSGYLGYTSGDIDVVDNVLVSTADYGFDRYQGALSLKASRWFGKVNLSGHIGYGLSSEHADAYTDSSGVANAARTNDFEQVDIGIKAGYLYQGVMPYAAISYGNDTNITAMNTQDRDEDGLVYTLGTKLFTKGPLSGGFYYRTTDRDKIKNDTFAASLTVRF